MEIIHQLTFRSKDEPRLFQILHGSTIKMKVITLPEKNNQSISVLIPESSSIWPEVQPFVGKATVYHGIETSFSQQEILDAEWMRIVNVYENGYPQPEKTWVTNPNNYEYVCNVCGVYKQVKPYQIAKEPNMEGNSFMSLVWTGDTLFTTPEVLNQWEERHVKGFEPWSAIMHKDKTISKTILQIFIPNMTRPGLVEDESMTQKICPDCGVKKFSYHRYGKMKYKRSSIPSGVDILRTYEWFGSGHLAFQEILISNYLARIFIEHNWRGVTMKVVDIV